MQYRIVDALDSQQLSEMINKLLKEDWHLLGGISITGDFHKTIVYAQAMVKMEEGEIK